MEETTVVTNGECFIPSDIAIVTDEVEIQEEEASSSFAESRNRSMVGGTVDDCTSMKILNHVVQQHKSVYSNETLSKHFHDEDVLNVAVKCWEQVNESMHGAIEGKFVKVLKEFGVGEKLFEMDKLWDDNNEGKVAWRPSGAPVDDCADAEGVVVRQQVIPRFQEEFKQVHSISTELQQVLRERQNTMKSLELEVQTLVNELGEFCSAL